MRGWDEIQALAGHPQVLAFSHVIREGESSQSDDAFHTLYGGGKFDSFDDHPRIRFPITYQGKPNYTTAAGAFQIVERTWNEFVSKYGPMDFSPANQLLCTVWLIERAGALDDVLEGDINAAIRKLGEVWTSLQLPKIKAKAAEVFRRFGGSLSGDPHSPPTQEVKPMAPIVLPLLEVAASLIPQLGKLFGSGSEVATRNVAAGTIIADKLVEATKSVNLQEAVEKLQSDPQALEAGRQAVSDVMFSLGEVGGGIAKAREAAADPNQVPFWRNPAFLISLAILPLIYMVAVAILFGVGGQSWSDDIKTLFVTAIVSGALGSIQGFFLGSSLSSQRKDALIAK